MPSSPQTTAAPTASGSGPHAPPPHLGALSGTLLIVANMIGVGVFTTTGLMAKELPSPGAILAAWLAGGVAALCGALSYAELGAALPRNGGEYRLLSHIYHPAVGFIAAFISQIVGFAAPLALFAMVFGQYLEALVPRIPAAPAGLALIALLALLHSVHVGAGHRFHDASTLGKVALILLFIFAGIARGDASRLASASQQATAALIVSPAFAVQLVYVSFSYSGWNAAAYLAAEFRRPGRDLPISLIAGTLLVVFLYLGLNAAFLVAAPLAELAGKEEVGLIAAVHLFGDSGGKWVSLLIVVGLVSTVSANLIAGPRVLEALGHDWPVFRRLSIRRGRGGPIVAIGVQAALAAAMLVSSRFDTLLTYIGVTLSLCAAATVLGVFVLRAREPHLPRPYRTWGYPATPALFLVLEGWMVVFIVRDRPLAAIASAATVVLGLALYLAFHPRIGSGR
ncbi:MAG: APC family permease [Planctomycetaceae bacterium]